MKNSQYTALGMILAIGTILAIGMILAIGTILASLYINDESPLDCSKGLSL